ncbi:hypothetical protein [Streptomyces sp. NPDC059247]|uniref:hypothetical protein n=1 Tax=Streptomyces sp. NPDC059247 TaxID=3346790 RepID=UPI00368B3570
MSRLTQIIENDPTASGEQWKVHYWGTGGRTGRQREKSFARKKDAVDFVTKMEGDRRETINVDPDAGEVSLRRYVDDWLAKKTASAGTLESYERIVRLHVAPTWRAR